MTGTTTTPLRTGVSLIRKRAALAAISEIIERHRGSIPSFMTGNWQEAFQRRRLFIRTAEHQQFLTIEISSSTCALGQLHRCTLTAHKRRWRDVLLLVRLLGEAH